MNTSLTVRKVLLIVGLAICGSGVVSATTADIQVARTTVVKALAGRTHATGMNTQATSQNILPGKILKFDWEDAAWSIPTTILRAYTPEGLVSRESVCNQNADITATREFTYNSDGMLVQEIKSQIDGVTKDMTPVEKTTYEYDPIVTNFCINKASETFRNGKWTLSESESYEVSRNADGNVTDVIYSLNSYQQRSIHMDYNETGYAEKISIYEYIGDWKLKSVMNHIVWKKTDGQLLETADNFGNFMTGDNLIKRYSQDIYDNGQLVMNISMDINYHNDGGYIGTISGYLDGLSMQGSSLTHTMLDNGGYETVMSIKINLNGTAIPLYSNYVKQELDSWGNLILAFSAAEEDGVIRYYDYLKGEVSYSVNTGLPELYVLQDLPDIYKKIGFTVRSIHEEPSDLIYKNKYEFLDYNTSGINTIATEAGNNTEYYDLNGIRVDHPTKGIHIMLKNGKATKVIL